MPSSTSSSSERPVEGPWLLTWGLALVLAAGALGWLELQLRAEGHNPSANIDNHLWTVQRHKVVTTRKTPVALLGASRISAGFSPGVFNEHYPDFEAIMLARAGRSPAATLVDLANDESFNGIVVLSVLPGHLIKKTRNEQRGLVKKYRKEISDYGYINRFANRSMAAHVDDMFAFRNNSVELDVWAKAEFSDGEPLDFVFIRGHADFSRSLYLDRIDRKKIRAKRLRARKRSFRKKKKPPAPKQFLKQAQYYEEAIQKLLDRGSRVVLVRYPTTDEHYAADQAAYPRAKYWDAFAAQTAAETIHFEDYETLSGYDCVDSSHLNYTDVPRYTLALAKVMEDLGVLEPVDR